MHAHAAVASAVELSRQHGVHAQTIYRWKQKYGRLEGSKLRRLKALQAANARLNRLVSEQALDNQTCPEPAEWMLKEVLGEKW